MQRQSLESTAVKEILDENITTQPNLAENNYLDSEFL